MDKELNLEGLSGKELLELEGRVQAEIRKRERTSFNAFSEALDKVKTELPDKRIAVLVYTVPNGYQRLETTLSGLSIAPM